MRQGHGGRVSPMRDRGLPGAFSPRIHMCYISNDDILGQNCAIKPPTMVALRERHRRLCKTCTKAPLPLLVSPPLDSDLPLSDDAMKAAICQCSTHGVWLCQPCGRSIRGADHDYKRYVAFLPLHPTRSAPPLPSSYSRG
jgi:hypothetical protein